MIRRLLLALFLSVTAFAPLPAVAGAEDLPAAGLPPTGGDEGQHPVEPAAPAKGNDGMIAVTRSDGSAGRSKPPDQKEVRKLVGSIRDGMKRADRAERQRVTRRVIQYRPARSRR